MDNKQGLVEQPLAESEIGENIDSSENAEGSMYGKFKDATSMLKAYKNLEAEFTRKSQRVSALEKMLSEKEGGQEIASKESDALTEEDREMGLSENATVYAYENATWQESVGEFFSANPDAVQYKSRMSRILHENPEYCMSPKCLEVAYGLAKSEGLKQPAELIKDQKFLEEYVLSDSRIKDIIVTQYIQSLTRGGVPKVISGNPSVQMATPRPDAPRTIKEAGRLAQKYLG